MRCAVALLFGIVVTGENHPKENEYMAQRNPMNQRYQGDGPGGQTRKSAASAKPVTQAASSVHIKKAPQTDSEKRAARKAREKEMERKSIERARRAAERAKAEASAGETDKQVTPPAPEKPRGLLGKLLAPAPNMPSTEEYRKWKRVYWMLMVIGIVAVALSFGGIQVLNSASTTWMVALGVAYVAIIAAFIVDFKKVKPLIKEHQRQGVGNRTPKQMKHELEAKERAASIEAARKAARDAKRAPRRRKSETIVPGEDDTRG
jgi:hypothetical protein